MEKIIQHFSTKKEVFDEYDIVSEKFEYYSRIAKSSLIIWGAMFFIVGLVLCIGTNIWFWGAFSLIPGGLMILGGVLMQANNKVKRKIYTTMFNSLSDKLYCHYLKYSECPVRPEYVNPKILRMIMNVLQYGMVNAIK